MRTAVEGFVLVWLASCAATPVADAPPPPACCPSGPADEVAQAAELPPPASELAPAAPLEAATTSVAPLASVRLPDVLVLDQDGRELRLSDVTGTRAVAIQFVFTTCTTICPPLAANFAALQDLLLQRGAKDVALLSVTVDPRNDTPERLRAFATRFGAQFDGQVPWTLVTGRPAELESIAKALGVFSARRDDHTPLVVVGRADTGAWRRIDGMAAPETIAGALAELRPAAAPPSAAQAYFTEVELVDHEGREVRLYSDLIRDRVVVIDSFFAECTGVCPVLAKNLRAVQDVLGPRLGRDAYILSITVDPSNDSPERLREYAKACGARPGWLFLSGEQGNVATALGKLGYAVAAREQHSNVILVGNDRTGLWKKAHGLAEAAEVVAVVESVLHDRKE